jgi:dUTP pyrophosphatase
VVLAVAEIKEILGVEMEIKIKKLNDKAIIPTYATDGSGAFDIYATNYSSVMPTGFFQTGLSFEIPEGYVMLVFSRSGHGFSKDVRLANCVGVIDSDYRGELKVKLTNDGVHVHGFKEGERIAQALIIPIPKVTFNVVEDLSSTERGEGGFGSTGT